MRRAGDVDRLPMDILAATKRIMDDPRAHRRIGHPVDKDEAAKVVVFGIGGKGHRPVERDIAHRSEEHTSELQSLMRISYAVFCLKKKTQKTKHNYTTISSKHHIHKHK